ncbi:LacI family DNA-binding transcriptional regulator [Rhodoglobus aureus]|uniref:LacI family DNA-binding transcriptional regulator n=1 Tax=Rhodoglobus aureus TaxID=191497 RepID=A0ABN1VET5_9MICO
MAKISDVAALAGVSASAVSRVLSGDPSLRVSASTRERVIAAAKELAYVPNHAARSLRTSRSRTIALVVPDVNSAVFAELASGAEDEAASRGLAIVLARAERLTDGSDWLRRMLGEARIDGVILQLPDGPSTIDLESMAVGGTRIVVINSLDSGQFSTVVLDDAAGIRTAVEHLRAAGHTEIGLVGGHQDSATGRRREASFLAVIREAGLPVRNQWITDFGYSGAEGRAAMEVIAANGAIPTALVVANLNAALGVLATASTLGLRVPTDISIVALHDVWYADATWPPITTVRMPLSQLGATAVARLMDGDPTSITHDTVSSPEPVLVVRQSTDLPRQSRK